jgi:subtilase family serine protease
VVPSPTVRIANARHRHEYHQFLTAEQFIARFAPADADVAGVVASLAKYGLSAERATATTLRVTGSAANMERAFAVSLHSYSVPARDGVATYSYHAPLSGPTIPAEIVGAVSGVLGLDTRPSLRPLHVVSPLKLGRRPDVKAASTGNSFGLLTVTDFAAQYDVNPLYKQGISGKGRTLGIMTFASLTPSDPFAYWKAVGLTVDPTRLRIVNIDGGPGAPSDDSGSIETTLDVEQSGGISPAAHIVLYQGPNTNQAFVDVLAAAVDANVAESLSVSVPDVSFNADPETGYVIYYTSEPSGVFGQQTFYGGTSFVAPQLNGVTALLGQIVDGRIGLLNYPLYESAHVGGSAATVHPIAYGDNWFYHGSKGYNPGAGLGTLDVANFAKYLSREF